MGNPLVVESCHQSYNATNQTTRDFQSGIPNVSRQNYVQKCVAHYNSRSDVSTWLIAPYAAIFLLSVIGNTLVILTLIRHKKMRTITNMYLLNLAIADLLVAVYCMPFSLVGMLMQDFVFGSFMCVSIRYAQGE